MAAFTAKLPTHGWCAGLSNVSGAYGSPSSRFNTYGCTNFLSTLCWCKIPICRWYFEEVPLLSWPWYLAKQRRYVVEPCTVLLFGKWKGVCSKSAHLYFFTGKSLVLLLKNEYDAFHLRRIAQLVRALRWHRRGLQFESGYAYQDIKIICSYITLYEIKSPESQWFGAFYCFV